ncbi:MAG: hypothetical protein Q4A56_01860 [Porphyromonadaceae bacterium]|nr:hypothetical protein [Porphyromonadaceae bacterium]
MESNVKKAEEKVNYKNRWDYVKKEIRARPLLAYKSCIPYEQFDEYMRGYPDAAFIQYAYDNIQSDKKKKTARIQKELVDIVAYRGVKRFAQKVMISDSYLRDIISGKKDTASYNIIDKVEIFINSVNPDFELSLENLLTPKKHVAIEVENIILQIDFACHGIYQSLGDIKKAADNMRLRTDMFWDNVIPINASLNHHINELIRCSDSLNDISEMYFKK